MNVQHINIKFFIENPESVDLEKFGPIFNGWIQKHVAEELLIDVADYRHVHHGPGMVLIGHEANYSLDYTGGRLGLLYNRKAEIDGSTEDKLAQASRAALIAASRLEKENGLKFNGQELQVSINDRLLAPNTEETFKAVEDDFKHFFDQLYKGADYQLDHKPDPRKRFNIDVKANVGIEISTLLQNLGVEQVHV